VTVLQNSANTHLNRQGELFVYMHEQMLARYNAEREAHGLLVVTACNFNLLKWNQMVETVIAVATTSISVVSRGQTTIFSPARRLS